MSSLSPDQRPDEDPLDPSAANDVRGELIPEAWLPGVDLPDGAGQMGDTDAPDHAAKGSAGAGDSKSDGLDSSGLNAGERLAITRGRQVATWLSRLEPQAAPFALEGLVVAGMNAGHRQQRSVDSLALLGHQGAPVALDGLVAAHILRSDPQARFRGADGAPGTELRAPDGLARLVEERVVEPEGTMVRGMAKRLDAVQAPSGLQSRLEREISDGLTDSKGRQRGRLFSGRAMAASFALAAVVFLNFSSGDWVTAPSDVTDPAGGSSSSLEVAAADGVSLTASGLSFRVVRVTNETLTDADRAVIGALGLPVEGEG